MSLRPPDHEEYAAVLTTNQSPSRGRVWTVGTLTYSAVGLAVLFLWLLLGDFAWNMKDKAIVPLCQIMLRDYDAPVWLVGLLIGSVPAALGLVLGPVIGVVSDRYRSRWGRRIPFLLGATPFIALGMLGLAATPAVGVWLHARLGPNGASLRTCQISAFAFFWSLLDIASIVANSLYGALVNDVVPQHLVGRFFGLFRCVALGAGIIFNYWLMGKADGQAPLMLAGLGLLYGACFTLMCLRVKEGQYPPPPPQVRITTPLETLRPVIAYLKECYGNPFFLSFFLATTLGGLTLGPVNAYSLYHSRSVHLSDDMYGKCIALSYAISLVLAYPLGILADRFHPLRVGLVSMVLYAAATLFGFFYAFTAGTFFIAFALHTVVSGAYITATASISQRLLPSSKFAEVSAAGGVIGAIAGIFVTPALGAFIEWRHNEYRYVFLLAGVLAIVTCLSYGVLFYQYIARGGDQAFVPPE